jgi:hypothetical protein
MAPPMIRSIRVSIALCVALALGVVVAVPAGATIPGPKGTLTNTEYVQLTDEQVAFLKLDKTKHLTFKELYAACHTVGKSTQLLKSVRSNCDIGLGTDQALVGFYSDTKRCSGLLTSTTTSTTTTDTGTTTTDTGTTTTDTDALTSNELKYYACLQPEYAVVSHAAESVYEGQTSLRRSVLARDFILPCTIALAPSIAELKALRRLVATSLQLTNDVALITKIANGNAPESAINQTQLQTNAVAFTRAAKALAAIGRPQNLSLCPYS